MAQETEERLIHVTIMSIESDILREIDFAVIIKDFAMAIEKVVRPLNLYFVLDIITGRYTCDPYTWPIRSRDPERSSHDPNTLRAQYLENSWRCYLATIAADQMFLHCRPICILHSY